MKKEQVFKPNNDLLLFLSEREARVLFEELNWLPVPGVETSKLTELLREFLKP